MFVSIDKQPNASIIGIIQADMNTNEERISLAIADLAQVCELATKEARKACIAAIVRAYFGQTAIPFEDGIMATKQVPPIKPAPHPAICGDTCLAFILKKDGTAELWEGTTYRADFGTLSMALNEGERIIAQRKRA